MGKETLKNLAFKVGVFQVDTKPCIKCHVSKLDCY